MEGQNGCGAPQQNGITPNSVCDVGCGSGELLRQLSLTLGDNVQFSGYEVSADAYRICKEKESDNLRFYCEDILAKASVSFDVLLCIDVIEHVEDFYGFLRRLRTLSTYTVFHIPLDLSVENIVRVHPLQRERKRVGHIHFFTKETALAALNHVGYDVVDSFFTIGSVELPAKGWRSAIMKIPRRIMFSVSQDLTARLLGGCSLMVLVRYDEISGAERPH